MTKMPIKCPLCLDAITSDTRFVSFCAQHGLPKEPFHPGPQAYRSGLICAHLHESRPVPLRDLPWLAHVGCRCHSPYWREGGLKVPKEGEPIAFSGGSEARPVKHWLPGLLQRIADDFPERPEMWFPEAAFRAANYLYQGASYGCLALLVGNVNAGKTILSLMAMNWNSYPKEYEDTRNFVYVSPSEDEGAHVYGQQFHDALYVAGQLVKSEDCPVWVRPTAPTVANLKAVFIPRRHSQPQGRKQAPCGGLLHAIAELFGPDATHVSTATGEMEDGYLPQPAWHVILFHDTAGEQAEKAYDIPLMRLESSIDRVIFVVDVCDLTIMGGKRAGLRVAFSQMFYSALKAENKCVVITKLDRLQVTGDGDPAHLKKLVEYIEAIRKDRTSADSRKERELLLDCLSAGKDTERRLATKIANENITVFFAWTEDLDNVREGELPTPYGIQQLVEWCLDCKL